jgi:GT2 family glycosyltransferase
MKIDPHSVLPYVSFLICTHNRREVLLRTLGELAEVQRRSGLMTETIVVDNASTDGTADAVATQFPDVHLIRHPANRGACAKNLGLQNAVGQFVMFLDDDSWPTADSIGRLVDIFSTNLTLAAAVFDVILPDASHECSAYPKAFIGCATAFRREALKEVGGLVEDYFMQAEEYDLSLRLLDAGWDIQRFTNLLAMHQKTPTARRPARTTRLDARNNLTLVTRYFPKKWMLPFAIDWMRRYRWIAQTKGWDHEIAFWTGVTQGIIRSLRPGHRRPVSMMVFEHFAMIREIQNRMKEIVRDSGHHSILLIDVGKNIYPFFLAAKSLGLRVTGVADNKLAHSRRRYRGVPIVNDEAAQLIEFDAAVIANISPVHAAQRRDAWRQWSRRPVIDLFEQSESLALVA